MFTNLKSTLIGLALPALLAGSPACATEILFDSGVAIDNAGTVGGTGYNNNELTGWQVYDNFTFTRDNSIESVRFQMAGGTEPFKFLVYADDAGRPGMEIFSLMLNAGDYSFGPAREYLHGSNAPDIGHDFSFDLATPLTLAPGTYWLSFLGTGSNLFRTLGTGPGDGLLQKRLDTGLIINRPGNTSFRLIGQPFDAALAFIDIKPGSDDNPINPRSNGVIPVAVLGSIDFDATQISVASVVFGPNEAAPAHNGHVEDVNGDGFLDMLFHFDTQDTGIQCGDTEAYLSGATFSSEGFANADSITTVGCNDPDPDPDDGNPEDNRTLAGGTALDWSMLPGLLILSLLGFRRRRAGR